jgi:hypothetical protein
MKKIVESEKKYPQFRRKSKGALAREARRYIQHKQGYVKLISV